MPTLLELALLGMDVYEKEQDAGLNPMQGIGTYSLGLASPPISSTGFFAQAYSYAGDIVIAYRGTSGDMGDWATNFGGTLGVIAATPQHRSAAEFYQVVTSGHAARSDVFLTGHSLGGNLAGFVRSLYRTSAAMFNAAIMVLLSSRTPARVVSTATTAARGS